jgi:hypothetical protein
VVQLGGGRELVGVVLTVELTAVIGAAPYGRTPTGRGSATAPAADVDDDRCGLELRIPRLHAGSSFRSLLERLRRIEAVVSVVRETYLHGRSQPQGRRSGQALGADVRTCSRSRLPGPHGKRIWSTNPPIRLSNKGTSCPAPISSGTTDDVAARRSVVRPLAAQQLEPARSQQRPGRIDQ